MRKAISVVLFLLFAVMALAQVSPAVPENHLRYYFVNTSLVNEQSYTDDEIFINVVYPMTGMDGYFDGNTQSFQNINNAPNYTWPNGSTARDFNVALSSLPIDNTGRHYIDMPMTPAGERIYVSFGQRLYRPDPGNPILDNPGNPNYNAKVETIEFNYFYDNDVHSPRVFTNTSRVDRYAYPMGEELYCAGGSYDKVGETVTHEMLIQKWKRFVHDDFQYSYDPIRDVINAPKGTSYFYAGNPGEGYFDEFVDNLFEYCRTHTLHVYFDGTEHTVQTEGDELVWSTGQRYPRSAFNYLLVNGNTVWDPRHGECFKASLYRGAVQLTEERQDWTNPDNFWKTDVCSDYMAFFHSDLASFESKTYAYDLDDVFDQSSTQVCDWPESVVLSLGGFGLEHAQELDRVYITPLDGNVEVAQYGTLQLEANGVDSHDWDMDFPADAVITWSVTDPSGATAENLISADGQFGPTDVTGDYEVTLTVVTGGKTYTADRIVTVKEPMDVAQVCTGPIGTTAEYRLEIIGKTVYLTLIPLEGHGGGPLSFFFGRDDVLNHWGRNTLTPNVPYPMKGFFFGEEMWFWISENDYYGALIMNHIPKLGTCDGMGVLEDVIALFADDHTMSEDDAPYTIPVSAVSNVRPTTPFALPDAVCDGTVTFSGVGVDPLTGVFTPTTAGTYPITITYPAAKGDVVKTINITVTPSGCLVPVAVNLGPDQTICQGETATFDAGAGFAEYVWTGTGVDHGQTFEASVSGTYSVTVTDADGCKGTDDVVLTVNERPALRVPYPDAVCAPNTVSIEQPAETGYTFAYYEQDQTTIVANPSAISESGVFYITKTDNATSCVSDFVRIETTVNAKPTLSIVNPDAVCEPNTVSIEQPAEAGYTFAYYEADQVTPVNVPAAVATSGTYYVTKTNDATLCVSDMVPVTVTINGKPLFRAVNPDAVCEPNTVSIEQPAETGYTFAYYEQDQTTIVANPSAISESGTYYITKTDNATLCVSDMAPVEVTVIAQPKVEVRDASICGGGKVQLWASGGDEYQWSPSTGLDNPDSQTPVATVTESTTYQVVVSNGECQATGIVRVEVFAVPRIRQIDETYNDALAVYVDGGLPPYRYILDGVESNDFVFKGLAKDRSYTIGVTDQNSCSQDTTYLYLDKSIKTQVFFSPNDDGMNDTWKISGIEFYPEAKIYIYDKFGKLIVKYKGSDDGWNGKASGRAMPSGDYWYVIILDSHSKKISGHFTLKR